MEKVVRCRGLSGAMLFDDVHNGGARPVRARHLASL
jgi:hypothetical protein